MCGTMNKSQKEPQRFSEAAIALLSLEIPAIPVKSTRWHLSGDMRKGRGNTERKLEEVVAVACAWICCRGVGHLLIGVGARLELYSNFSTHNRCVKDWLKSTHLQLSRNIYRCFLQIDAIYTCMCSPCTYPFKDTSVHIILTKNITITF